MKIYHIGVNFTWTGLNMATLEALQRDWLCVKKPPIAHMLSVYSSTQCTYKMQSLTMTQKDLAIDRRQIPAWGKGSAQRFGDRKGRRWDKHGNHPSPRFVVTVKSVVLFIYLYNQKVGQCSSSGCLSSSSSSGHSRNSGAASPAGEAASSTTSSWGRCGPASWSRPGWHRRGAQRRRRPEEDQPPDLRNWCNYLQRKYP